MTEEYRPVPGFEYYHVSNLGNVASTKTGKWKPFHKNLDAKGYPVTCFRRKDDPSKYKHFKVHQLVAMAFLNHVPNGSTVVVDHINFNPADNRVSNLRIVPFRFNTGYRRRRSEMPSKYPGVTWSKESEKWLCRIACDYKTYYLGHFSHQEEAAKMYNIFLNLINETAS